MLDIIVVGNEKFIFFLYLCKIDSLLFFKDFILIVVKSRMFFWL